MADQFFFGLTDAGKERKNNEDTFIAQQSANGKFIIACVIDGVGGYAGGEIAASLARETILKCLDKPSGEIIPLMTSCFNKANERILEEKKRVKEHSGMACVITLALVDLERNQFFYAHVGDTRLYLLRDHSLVKISHDQSFVGFLEDSGRINEKEAMNHPKRNEINHALGFEANLDKNSDYIETGQSPFLPGDMLLLCSDGLTDMVNKEEITAIITTNNSLKDKCGELIAAANHNGGRDNITAVLVQNNKTPSKHQATMPEATLKKNEIPNNDLVTESSEENNHPSQPMQSTPGNKGTIIFLTLMMLVFLGAAIWQFLKNNHPAVLPQKPADTVVVKPLNAQEIKLQTAIDQAKNHLLILADTAYKSPIIISRAININNDTLLIKAIGKIELQCDSGYKGAALQLAAKCKNIILDSLLISNFKIGLIGFNNALTLKNIRFVNCAVPLQNLFDIPNQKYITGKAPAMFFIADSIPVNQNSK